MNDPTQGLPASPGDVRAWLQLPRSSRRKAMRDARRHLIGQRFASIGGELGATRDTLTKPQRRAATPWQPVLRSPVEAHFASGRQNRETLVELSMGFNRGQRRAMKAKKGPKVSRKYVRRDLMRENEPFRIEKTGHWRPQIGWDRFALMAERYRKARAMVARQKVYHSRAARVARWSIRQVGRLVKAVGKLLACVRSWRVV